MSVRRIFVEKRQGFFDIPAQQLHDDLVESFRLSGLKAVRLFNRYDIEGLSDEEYAQVKAVVFSEPLHRRRSRTPEYAPWKNQ